MPRLKIARLLLLIGTLVACSTPQPSVKLERFDLEGVGDTTMPATVFDSSINAPEGEFHLRVQAMRGWFSTNNRRYEHGVDIQTFINGRAQPVMRWRDQGRCTPNTMALSCESDVMQGVKLEIQHGAAVLSILQDLSGQGAAQYVFGRKQPN